MIVVRVNGGIGNQLFQYATALNLAIKNNTIVKFDISEFKLIPTRKFELDHFDIPIHFASVKEIPYRKQISKTLRSLASSVMRPSKFLVVNEKYFHFDPTVLTFKGNIYLDGYWQSYKYFDAIKYTLFDQLNITSFTDTLLVQQEMIQNTCSVALHVRRGDYVNNKYHPLCTADYYQQAIACIASRIEKPVFFVFSDDIEWCRMNLKISFDHFFISGNDSWMDFKLMALCKHFILANSTFSWWGAYLGQFAQKIVIAPGRWFNNKGILLNDLFLEDWVIL